MRTRVPSKTTTKPSLKRSRYREVALGGRSFTSLVRELSDSVLLLTIFGLILSGYLGIALFLVRVAG